MGKRRAGSATLAMPRAAETVLPVYDGEDTLIRLNSLLRTSSTEESLRVLARMVGARPGESVMITKHEAEFPPHDVRVGPSIYVKYVGRTGEVGFVLGRAETGFLDSFIKPGMLMLWDISAETHGSQAEGVQRSAKTGQIGRSAESGVRLLEAFKAASEAGVERAFFVAGYRRGGIGKKGMNGYRTWPNLGADGAIPNTSVEFPKGSGRRVALNRLVREEFGPMALSVQMLYRFPRGRTTGMSGKAFWAQYGRQFNAYLDLSPEGRTMRLVNDLLARRGSA